MINSWRKDEEDGGNMFEVALRHVRLVAQTPDLVSLLGLNSFSRV